MRKKRLTAIEIQVFYAVRVKNCDNISIYQKCFQDFCQIQ